MKPATPSAGARYALLHLGATRLMLSQSDIREIEGVDDINPADAPPGGVGRVRVGRQTYPVYCLSDELGLMDGIPAPRQMCVLLAYQGGQFGLLCDQVQMLETPDAFHPLPECMRLADSPVDALVVQPDGLACLGSVQRLAALIPRETGQPSAYQAGACQTLPDPAKADQTRAYQAEGVHV
jgi:hypothetical protein